MKTALSITKNITRKRARIALIAFLAFACYLVVNIFRLDYLLYAYYKDKAFDQLTTTSTLKAERGKIYDANLNLLAATETTWRVFVSTREIRNKSKQDGKDYARIIASGVAEIFGLDENSVYGKITNTSTLDVTIKKVASEDEYKRTLALIDEYGLENLLLTEAQSSRYYPEASLAAHVLGFTGSDGQGLYGLEYSYNEILTGTDGYYLYAKDANGNALKGDYVGYVPATDGNSIVTTIDSYVQAALESQLEEIRATHQVTNRVTGIVMDTHTGAIIAMATSSPFDPNSPFELDEISRQRLEASGLVEDSEEYKKLKTELLQIMWSNKAVSETYEPGSTFKVVTVSAALDSGAATINDRFSCGGYLNVGGWRIKCHKTTGHGSGFTLGYGLQMSCNPTMMTVAARMGAETFYDYVDAFGYLEKTNIDLPSEASSIFHEKEAIGTTELATAAFGQRFKVTIITQLTAIAAVANGGRLVEPYVVDKVIDPDGTVIYEHETVVRRTVISEAVADAVTKVLVEGVSGDGGAKNAYVEGYEVAAKTGTSQKFDILDENGNSYLRIGSTVGYVSTDAGGIAVIIVVDEPQGSIKYGSTVAAPYVSALLTDVLPYLNYQSSCEPSTAVTDNYVGMNIKSATKAMDSAGIKYTVIGNGSVVTSQTPSAGVKITKAISSVILYTDESDALELTVPNLVGLTLAEANTLATNCGLNILLSSSTLLSRDSILTVTAQSLPAGTKVKYGTVIEIYAIALDFED